MKLKLLTTHKGTELITDSQYSEDIIVDPNSEVLIIRYTTWQNKTTIL